MRNRISGQHNAVASDSYVRGSHRVLMAPPLLNLVKLKLSSHMLNSKTSAFLQISVRKWTTRSPILTKFLCCRPGDQYSVCHTFSVGIVAVRCHLEITFNHSKAQQSLWSNSDRCHKSGLRFRFRRGGRIGYSSTIPTLPSLICFSPYPFILSLFMPPRNTPSCSTLISPFSLTILRRCLTCSVGCWPPIGGGKLHSLN